MIPSAPVGRGSRRLLRALGRTGTVLAAAAQAVLHEAGVLSAFAAGRLGAIYLILAGLVLCARAGIHLHIGYWLAGPGDPANPSWTRTASRALSALVALEFVVAASMVIVGVVLLVEPNNVAELVMALALTIALMVSSDRTVVLALKLGLPRASDVISRCRSVESVRNFAKRWENLPGFHLLDIVWDAKTAVGKVSGLVMVLVVGMIAVAAAQTTSLLPGVDKLLSPPHVRHVHPTTGGKKKKGHVGGGKHPKSSGSGTPGSAEVDPPRKETYDELCGRTIAPGEGAIGGADEQLRMIWERYGGVVAGCAELAHELGDSATWYAIGRCGGALRSIALAGPQAAVMLLQQPAQLADHLLSKGLLVGASPRTPIGANNSGDYQIVDSTDGSFVAIREEETDGNGGPAREPLTCEELTPTLERYVIVAPGMTTLWLRYERLTGRPVWPARNTSTGDPHDTLFSFYSADDQRNTVASGSCSSPTRCELWSGELRLRNEPGEAEVVSAEEVSRLGPG